MSQAGYTPIQLYYSSTASAAPSAGNLAAGEIAINITDGKLFYKDNGGAVQVLATKSSAISSVTNNGVVYVNGSGQATTGSALTFDGTKLSVGAAGSALSLDVKSLSISTGVSATTARFGTGNDTWDFRIQNAIDGGGVGNVTLAGPAGHMAFSLASSEQMRLTSTGLGIGTSSPAGKLHVSGGRSYFGANSDPFALAIGYSPARASAAETYFIGATNSSTPDLTFSNSTGALNMTLTNSGNLGLGVTPSAWLSNAKAIQVGSFLSAWTGSNGSANLSFGAYEGGSVNTYRYLTTGDSPTMYQQLTGAHRWYTAPSGTAGNDITFTQAMTLDASGNFLVGTTSQISGGFICGVFDASTKTGLVLRTAANTSGAGFAAFTDNSGNTCGSITRVAATSAVTYNTISDHRLKNVIGVVSGSGERIDALEPIEYEWKSDGSRTRGFLAHKFQEVYPTSVVGEKDAVDAEGKPVYQTMQAGTAEVIADLVAELKSLRARVAQLESSTFQ